MNEERNTCEQPHIRNIATGNQKAVLVENRPSQCTPTPLTLIMKPNVPLSLIYSLGIQICMRHKYTCAYYDSTGC